MDLASGVVGAATLVLQVVAVATVVGSGRAVALPLGVSTRDLGPVVACHTVVGASDAVVETVLDGPQPLAVLPMHDEVRARAAPTADDVGPLHEWCLLHVIQGPSVVG
jgi:hypothetical protein